MIDLETLRVFAEVVLLDLVLAGDNAIIVGMVASRVPADIRKQVILWGIGAAVVMRIGFSLVAIQLLSITGLKLIGGLALLWVCWKMYQDIRGGHDEEAEKAAAEGSELTSLKPAIFQIMIADLSMSIDNVLAIASAARDHPYIMVFGLALSVAFMIFAATQIVKLLRRYPWIAWVGLILILRVALVMIYEDILHMTGRSEVV